MVGLTEGRIVHYVLPDGPSAGEHRPAQVVKVWRAGDNAPENGCSNLTVFTDWANDGGRYQDGLFWATSVIYSSDKVPGTWHWIEKA